MMCQLVMKASFLPETPIGQKASQPQQNNKQQNGMKLFFGVWTVFQLFREPLGAIQQRYLNPCENLTKMFVPLLNAGDYLWLHCFGHEMELIDPQHTNESSHHLLQCRVFKNILICLFGYFVLITKQRK